MLFFVVFYLAYWTFMHLWLMLNFCESDENVYLFSRKITFMIDKWNWLICCSKEVEGGSYFSLPLFRHIVCKIFVIQLFRFLLQFFTGRLVTKICYFCFELDWKRKSLVYHLHMFTLYMIQSTIIIFITDHIGKQLLWICVSSE